MTNTDIAVENGAGTPSNKVTMATVSAAFPSLGQGDTIRRHPSRVFLGEFARRGLAPQNLSRLAADSGTVTSPLIPWNSCGAFMGAVLGVSTLKYAPYAIFCWVSPLLSVLYGFTGFRIIRTEPVDDAGPGDEEAEPIWAIEPTSP